MKGIKVTNNFQEDVSDTYKMQKKILEKLIRIIELENKDILIKI